MTTRVVLSVHTHHDWVVKAQIVDKSSGVKQGIEHIISDGASVELTIWDGMEIKIEEVRSNTV